MKRGNQNDTELDADSEGLLIELLIRWGEGNRLGKEIYSIRWF